MVATIDGVYAVIVPSGTAKYDEEKELQAARDAKQHALAKVEELRAKVRIPSGCFLRSLERPHAPG